MPVQKCLETYWMHHVHWIFFRILFLLFFHLNCIHFWLQNEIHWLPSKTECVYFKREGVISILSCKPLKLVNKFTYPGSYILSIEDDVDIRQSNARTDINKLLIIWKSDLSDKTKRNYFPSSGSVNTSALMHYINANKTHRRKGRKGTQECYMQFWTNPGSCTPQNSSCTATYHPSQKPSNGWLLIWV